MDKIDRLLDAIEHPERFDDRELELLLRDPEVKEVFDVLDKTRSSLRAIPAPDVAKEWETFADAHNSSRHTPIATVIRLFTRNVAASVAIGVVSLTAVAAVVSVSVSNDRNVGAPAEAEVEVAADHSVAHPDTVAEIALSQNPEIIIFDNIPLERVISRVAEHYGCEVIFRTESAKSLRLYFRWNQELSLEDVAESLNNFDQICLTVNGKTITIE